MKTAIYILGKAFPIILAAAIILILILEKI